jgi:CheY-like chemotaxis protein
MQAESLLEGKPERKILIGARRNADDALIDIVFSDVGEAAAKDSVEEAAKSGALGLQVCQAILQAHGGEVKLCAAPPLNSRFEVRLPAYDSEEKVAERQRLQVPAHPLTILIVETELPVQRRLMTLLSRRGHRSIPVTSAESGVDLIRRLRFDAVFCAVRLPGLNWVEFHQKIRREVPAFVLLSEGFDPDLSRSFKAGEGFILGRALDEEEVERLLLAIEARQEIAARR